MKTKHQTPKCSLVTNTCLISIKSSDNSLMFFCEQLLAHSTSALQGSPTALCLSPPSNPTATQHCWQQDIRKRIKMDSLDYSYSSYNSTWRMQGIFHTQTGLFMQNSFQSNVHYTKQAVTKTTLFLPPQMMPQHNIAESKVKEGRKKSQFLKRQIQNKKKIIHSDSKHYINSPEV